MTGFFLKKKKKENCKKVSLGLFATWVLTWKERFKLISVIEVTRKGLIIN